MARSNCSVLSAYINFMLEPEVGLANIDYIGYSTPNDWVFQLLDDEVKNDPVRYPDQELLDSCEYFVNLPPDLAAYFCPLPLITSPDSSAGNV